MTPAAGATPARPTEARRGIQRIVANYARLLGWLILGIVLTPFLFRWLGVEGYGLVALVGATLGISGVFQQLMNQSLIREIGAAYHSDDESCFGRIYNSSFVIALGMAALSSVVFTLLFTFVRVFEMPETMIVPARWFIAAQGAYSAMLVLTAPTFTLYRVMERFGWYAFWMILIRGTSLASAVILAWGFEFADAGSAVQWYGVLWSAMLCTVMAAAVITILCWDRRFIPSPRLIRRRDIREVWHTFGWNSAVHVAMNLHERLAAVLMNLVYGLLGNAVFNVALQLVSYVRMITTGVTFGLDAASARIATASPEQALRDFVRHSTRLQSFIALPAALSIFLYAEPVLRLWIGPSLADPEAMIPPAVVIVRLLTLSMAARAIADGWMFILYGAGHVRRYAPMVLAGGVASPVLGLALLVIMPEPWRFNAPAIGIAAVIIGIHFIGLPLVAGRCLDLPAGRIFTPLLRPLAATIMCSPLLIGPALMIEHWTLLRIVAPCAAFGAAYAALGWRLVLTADERVRFAGAIQRRLRGRPGVQANS